MNRYEKRPQLPSIYSESYTRDDFQKEAKIGSIISLGANRDTVYTEDKWPTYIFHGFETCQYQYGHGCHGCQGKLLLESTKTGYKLGYCATTQRTEGPALISARWNKNSLPDELFEI